MKMHRYILFVCLPLSIASSPLAAAQSSGQFDGQINFSYGYLLHLPACYASEPESTFPLVLYLHGSGERGDDLQKVRTHGPPKFLDDQPDFPAIVISPQCPSGESWEALKLKALLDEIIATYRIDVDRVYVTGNSMGGYGTWELGSRYADMFAAIAPICGGGNPRRAAWRLTKTPVWVFHGMRDTVVPIEQSLVMVRALEAKGGNIKFTVYPEAQHDSWTQTYNNPEFWEWLLSQKRPSD